MPEAPDELEKLMLAFASAGEQTQHIHQHAADVTNGKKCTFCHVAFTAEELDSDETYREVKSWIHGPKLQSPVLRTQTGRRAHASCINKMIDGEAPDQEPLPGLEID